MAMVRCPECGKPVSDRALACPDCGCPLKGEDSGLAKLIFYRKGFASPFQTMIVLNDNGTALCNEFRVSSLTKKMEEEMEISIVGPTSITIEMYELRSGMLSTRKDLVHSESLTVEPSHSYLVTIDGSRFEFKKKS